MNYLLLMDDLRFYGATQRKINGLVDTVRVATEDIDMSFGFDWCSFFAMKM